MRPLDFDNCAYDWFVADISVILHNVRNAQGFAFGQGDYEAWTGGAKMARAQFVRHFLLAFWNGYERENDIADCDLEDNQQIVVAPRIDAAPNSLMFYGDSNAVAGLEPQVVSVVNRTFSAVLITSVYIAKDEWTASEQDDTEFFAVTLPDMTQPLLGGQAMDFVVEFEPSSVQRRALLVIETTHPSYASLVVELAGKFFVW